MVHLGYSGNLPLLSANIGSPQKHVQASQQFSSADPMAGRYVSVCLLSVKAQPPFARWTHFDRVALSRGVFWVAWMPWLDMVGRLRPNLPMSCPASGQVGEACTSCVQAPAKFAKKIRDLPRQPTMLKALNLVGRDIIACLDGTHAHCKQDRASGP